MGYTAELEKEEAEDVSGAGRMFDDENSKDLARRSIAYAHLVDYGNEVPGEASFKLKHVAVRGVQ